MTHEDFNDLDVETFLPVTAPQFEALTNEMLVALNKVTAPHFLSADHVANLLMNAIHAMDHKHGMANKRALFESIVNRISCQLTYAIIQGMQAKYAADKAAKDAAEQAVAEAETPSPSSTAPTPEDELAPHDPFDPA